MPAIPRSKEPWGRSVRPIHLVSTVEDVAQLDLPDDTPVAYVTQTTLSVDDTRGVIAALQARFSDLEGPDISDICYATQHRQSAVRDLCEVVDLLLVVGGRNSSNSNRLREIGVEQGLPSHLISDGSELDPAWLRGVQDRRTDRRRLGPGGAGARRHRSPAPAWRGRSRADGRRPRRYRVPPAARAQRTRGRRARPPQRKIRQGAASWEFLCSRRLESAPI